MHTALGGMHVVGKGKNGLVIAVVILNGDLRHGVVLHARHINNILIQRRLGAVEPGDKLLDAALKAHGVGHRLLPPQVGNGDVKSGVKEGLLPHTGVEHLVVIDGGLGKHLGVGLEHHLGAGAVGLADDGHLLGHGAAGKLDLVDVAVLMDPDLHPLGKGVDYAAAHAVEAAGDLVAAAAKLAAGVKDGIHHLQSGFARLGLDVHRDAAAVVGDLDDVAGEDVHGDVGAVARQRLVDGVVHDLIDQMVKAGGRGGADVHTRALAHRLQSLQHLDLRAAVLVLGMGGFLGIQDQFFVLFHGNTSEVVIYIMIT